MTDEQGNALQPLHVGQHDEFYELNTETTKDAQDLQYGDRIQLSDGTVAIVGCSSLEYDVALTDQQGNQIQSLQVGENEVFTVSATEITKSAQDLQSGDLIQLSDGSLATVNYVSLLSPASVDYNASSDAHTYFVEDGLGDSTSRNAIWVHNAKKPCIFTRFALGAYNVVKGHHIFTKAAFKGSKTYSKGKALSIGKKAIEKGMFNHDKATAMQRKLYDELAAKGRKLTMKAEISIARRVLVEGGASKNEAKEIFEAALRNLKSMKVKAPTRIPWN